MKKEQTLRTRAEQVSLEALVASIKHGPDTGLAMLKENSEPESIRRKLVILMQANRIKEAVESIRGRQAEEPWAELAIQAFGRNRELIEAENIFNRSCSFESRSKRIRCAFLFALVLFDNAILRLNSPDSHIKSGVRSTQLLKAKQILIPLYTPIITIGRVETEFEQSVLELALKTLHLLSDQSSCENVAATLGTGKPISLILAEATLRGWINTTPSNLSDRLRIDHPQSFDAWMMAAALEGLNSPRKAFQATKEILPKSKSRDEKFRIWKMLDAMADQIGAEAHLEVEEWLPSLLSTDLFLTSLHSAETLLRTGNILAAITLLQEIQDEDNVFWLQIWADANLRAGESETGFAALKKATYLLPDPQLYEWAAETAFTLSKVADAADLLSELIFHQPTNIRARVRLAFIYLNAEDYDQAAEEFSQLRQLQPEEVAHSVNQAVSLQCSGKTEAALELLDTICSIPDAPVQALVARAEGLKAKNQPELAFQGLKMFREKHWEDPHFLAAFRDFAYAAQEEKAAHEAFVRLQELQEKGAIKGAIRMVSFDEIKGHFQEFHRKKDELLRLTLEGKVPWLMAELALGRVPFLGWHLRTQPLGWLNEDALVRAEHTIYSTNAFFIERSEAARPILEAIKCPSPGTAVVVDMSALITLSQLNLLSRAAQYFGKLAVPASYMAHVLAESNKLVLHQKTQRTSLQEIRRALDSGRIQVIESIASGTVIHFPHVDEHSLGIEQGPVYRLRDIAMALVHSGRISDGDYQEIIKAAQSPAAADAGHPPLKAGQAVLVHSATLNTLHALGILEHTVSMFLIYISALARDEVVREYGKFEALESVYRGHSSMWEILRKEKRYVFVPRRLPTGPHRSEQETNRELYLSAYHLAVEQNAPLFADDRTCQVVAWNERSAFDCSSFGTDRFLPALEMAGIITEQELANAFLQLVSWRYRFTVPPSRVLLWFARNYWSTFPGEPLRLIACYVHACMGDPGLSSSFEQTDPPTTIASRLFMNWASVSAELIMDIWDDASVTEAKANEVTAWVVHNLLPSTPKTMAYPAAEALASILPRIVLTHALLYSGAMIDHGRVNRGLMRISEELGLSESEYFKVIMETFDGIRI